jgi:6-pyruvoyltetrahydropterin/6-carboxytetrahydropterin synthase
MITFMEFTFEAAHQIPPFSGLHGHSFNVEVALRGDPDPVYGWSVNLNEVEKVIDGLRRKLDHGYLNAIDGLDVPSLENVARWIWEALDRELACIDRVTVRRGTAGHAEGCIFTGEDARRHARPASRRQLDLLEA